MKIIKISLVVWLLISCSSHISQDCVTCSFDSEDSSLIVKEGNAVIVVAGAKQGGALQLKRGTVVQIEIPLKSSSSYRISGWLRTESGADNLSLQVTGLGSNNVSMTSAMATWTKVEKSFNVSANQKKAVVEVTFDKNQNGEFAYVDEIEIEYLGEYIEQTYTGIPEKAKREIKTDEEITMQPDEKIEWMVDSKLGMFIHWGLYAGPAQGEWYMENKGVSMDDYRKLAYPESGELYFDAADFDARKWMQLAQKAGFRYVNLTTQHHDGYALFESEYAKAFTSKQTHNRDFVREYVEAAREAGLKVGLYKTLINWRYPGYYDVTGKDCKTNKFGYKTAAWHKENARQMKEELYCMTRELLSNYGKIDQLFWDGGWLAQQGSDADAAYFWESGKYLTADNQWPIYDSLQVKDNTTNKPLGLMGMVRQLQPDIVVNPRSGWCGDYTCEEGGGAVKGAVRSGVVEKCMSITPGWGYNKLAENPERITSLQTIKRICADCMVRNMCFLVNVGPDRHGNVPPLIEQRLLEFGQWVEANASAIYGTRGGPWNPVDGQYGFTYRDNTIYIYFLGDYTNDTFTLPPVNKGMRAVRAFVLHSGEEVQFSQKKQTIELTGISPQAGEITIIAVEMNKNIR